MKTITILFIVLIASYSFSQENILLENQKNKDDYNLQEVKRIKFLPNKTTQILKPIRITNVTEMMDTLFYPRPATGNNNFGIFGQDVLLQWFKAPADINIIGVGLYCTENINNTSAELKIVKVNWDEAQLISQTQKHHGFYPANGSIAGITTFLDNPERTGNWVAIDSTETEPFEHDIWSDNGMGYPFIPDPTLFNYQWIDMSVLGNVPYIESGEVFGIVVKNTSIVLESHRIGFLAINDFNYTLYPGWKFYANGRLIPGVDKGWWTREFTFDFRVAVWVWSGGMIEFNFITRLNSTTSTDPRQVDANIYNPQNNAPLVSKLFFSTNGGIPWNSVDMEYLGNNNYTGMLPGFPPNTDVEYYIEATDTIGSNTIISQTISYTIFGPSDANTLVVLNGHTSITGYPQDYYFGPDIQSGTSTFAHDTWAYGQLPSDLLEHYDNLIEICNGGPENYNDSIIRPWLAAAGNRNYYLEGQDWLGSRYNYVDKNFVAGDFEFDILGINASFNDVSYANSTGQLLPSKLMPQAGTTFGQPLLDRFNTYSPVPDSIQYNPMYEGNSGDNNWIDGFIVESDVVVDVLTESRGIAGVPNVQNLPCAIHHTLPNGNKIFFASYWTYAVNTATNNNMPTYHWLGFTNESPAYQSLLWFGIPIITDVQQNGNNIPDVFSLSQNYPNPFNPVTTIKYTIPNVTLSLSSRAESRDEGSRVTLKVYDILGKEIATLVNEEQSAGTYELEFNPALSIRNLASGIYFYQLKAGSFVSTKKMILLK